MVQVRAFVSCVLTARRCLPLPTCCVQSHIDHSDHYHLESQIFCASAMQITSLAHSLHYTFRASVLGHCLSQTPDQRSPHVVAQTSGDRRNPIGFNDLAFTTTDLRQARAKKTCTLSIESAAGCLSSPPPTVKPKMKGRTHQGTRPMRYIHIRCGQRRNISKDGLRSTLSSGSLIGVTIVDSLHE
ncbi:unnamed protein product [Ectocarpus sp. 8 AP-2014]